MPYWRLWLQHILMPEILASAQGRLVGSSGSLGIEEGLRGLHIGQVEPGMGAHQQLGLAGPAACRRRTMARPTRPRWPAM